LSQVKARACAAPKISLKLLTDLNPIFKERGQIQARQEPIAAQQLGAAHNEQALDTQHLVFLSRHRYIY